LWICISIAFGVIAAQNYFSYRRLSDPKRATELGKLIGFPDGVTPFQDRFSELMRLIFKDMFRWNVIGFILATIGAIYTFFSLWC
jgi:hypothetical protein